MALQQRNFFDRHFVLGTLILTALYFLAAKFSLSLAFSHMNISPVWPPTGLAVGAVFLFGRRAAIGVLLGAILANLETFMSHGIPLTAGFGAASAIGVGNTLEALLGAGLLRRLEPSDNPLARTRGVFSYVAAVALVGCATSATIGNLTLCLWNLAPWKEFPYHWYTWWAGDIGGAVIFGPLILGFPEFRKFARSKGRLLEAGFGLLALLLLSATIFGPWSIHLPHVLKEEYFLLPLLLWFVFRFGVPGAAVAVPLVSGLVVWGTVHGYGHYASDNTNDALLLVQVFVGITAVAFLSLAAALAERRSLQQRLETQNEELEHRVDERTAQLRSEMDERRRLNEERLELQRKLLDGQRLESLGVLAAGIAHDFNNLLMPILGHATMASEKLAPFSKAQEDLEKIKLSTNRAADLIRQLLAYVGETPVQLKTISLNNVLGEMGRLFRVSIPRHIDVRLELDPEEPVIEADASQVGQIAMNLIVNASDALENTSGTIWVRSGHLSGDPEAWAPLVERPHLPPGEYAWLEVADDGPGMEETTRQRSFDPFFSTKRLGRGLGLSGILGIAKAHRGAVALRSEKGVGTSVRVYFPRSKAQLPAPLSHPTERTRAESGSLDGLVLVIDDEETVRNVLCQAVEFLGLKTVGAKDGDEGLHVFKQHAQQIDCVLLDLSMPKLTGTQVLPKLREIRPDTPVILMTGYRPKELKIDDSGPYTSILEKPFQMAALERQLTAALKSVRVDTNECRLH